MSADQCDFEHEGMCLAGLYCSGFVCPDSVAVGDCGLRECHGKNEDLVTLVTEEEYDAMYGSTISL